MHRWAKPRGSVIPSVTSVLPSIAGKQITSKNKAREQSSRTKLRIQLFASFRGSSSSICRKTEVTGGMTDRMTTQLLYASWLHPPRHNYASVGGATRHTVVRLCVCVIMPRAEPRGIL